jgi:hypothetical protein
MPQGYAVFGRCCHRRPAMLTPPGRNSVVLQQITRRPLRPASSAAAGARGDWGIVWLAVGDAWVVRLRARTEPTNAPAVEADDATSGDRTHGQGASATGRTAGSGWGCRCFAGHSARRGRIRCRCACPRTNDGRTASDHHDEEARACAQRYRPADLPHEMNCRRPTPDAHNRSTQACRARCSRQGVSQ